MEKTNSGNRTIAERYEQAVVDARFPTEFVANHKGLDKAVMVFIGRASGCVNVGPDRYLVLGDPLQGRVVFLGNYNSIFGKKRIGLTDEVGEDIAESIRTALSK